MYRHNNSDQQIKPGNFRIQSSKVYKQAENSHNFNASDAQSTSSQNLPNRRILSANVSSSKSISGKQLDLEYGYVPLHPIKVDEDQLTPTNQKPPNSAMTRIRNDAPQDLSPSQKQNQKLQQDVSIYKLLKTQSHNVIRKVSDNIDKLFEFGQKANKKTELHDYMQDNRSVRGKLHAEGDYQGKDFQQLLLQQKMVVFDQQTDEMEREKQILEQKIMVLKHQNQQALAEDMHFFDQLKTKAEQDFVKTLNISNNAFYQSIIDRQREYYEKDLNVYLNLRLSQSNLDSSNTGLNYGHQMNSLKNSDAKRKSNLGSQGNQEDHLQTESSYQSQIRMSKINNSVQRDSKINLDNLYQKNNKRGSHINMDAYLPDSIKEPETTDDKFQETLQNTVKYTKTYEQILDRMNNLQDLASQKEPPTLNEKLFLSAVKDNNKKEVENMVFFDKDIVWRARDNVKKIMKSKDNATALHWSARRNFSDLTNFLIEKGADLFAIDIVERTPLDYAIRSQNYQIVSLLKSFMNMEKQQEEYEEKSELKIVQE